MKRTTIQSPEQFHAAMSSVQSAMALLDTFDWQQLVDQVEIFEGAGSVVFPKMFLDMQKDPQWEIKKRLFKAAAEFTSEIDALRLAVSNEG